MLVMIVGYIIINSFYFLKLYPSYRKLNRNWKSVVNPVIERIKILKKNSELIKKEQDILKQDQLNKICNSNLQIYNPFDLSNINNLKTIEASLYYFVLYLEKINNNETIQKFIQEYDRTTNNHGSTWGTYNKSALEYNEKLDNARNNFIYKITIIQFNFKSAGYL
ncbi:MAG: hypothetical protein IPL96_05510 [Holophagaceae bacterium]|nr:hypothetical protein [Holophagaceae bacterium]